MTITGTSILQREPGVTAVLAPYGPRGPIVSGTSSTAANIELGDVVFEMNEYGLSFLPGIRLRATAIGAADQWVEGVVSEYTDNALTMAVDLKSGDGIYESWQINVAGEPGVQGPIGPTGATGQVPEAPQDLKSYLRLDAAWTPLDPDLIALAALTGTNTIYFRSAADTWSPVLIGSGIGFTGGTISAASGGGNVSNSGTPVAGQFARWINSQQIQGVDASTTFAPFAAATSGAGRLTFSSASLLLFSPYNGNQIKINGVFYTISGVVGLTNTNTYVNSVAAQVLVANTTYYVYLFNNAGTLTADFSTTTHATSVSANNAGTEIKNADETRTLIGMIRTNASGQFQDTISARYVLSWFNRRDIYLNGPQTGGASPSTSPVELTTAIRINFLTWGEESFSVYLSGYGQCQFAGSINNYALTLDGGVIATPSVFQCYANDTYATMGLSAAAMAGEGQHYVSVLGWCNNGWITMTAASICATIRG